MLTGVMDNCVSRQRGQGSKRTVSSDTQGPLKFQRVLLTSLNFFVGALQYRHTVLTASCSLVVEPCEYYFHGVLAESTVTAEGTEILLS